MAKRSEVEMDPFPSPPKEEEAVPSRMPDGVEMITLPRLTGDPQGPPPGWLGAYNSCGACGAFLGNKSTCSACSPGLVPSNISMSLAPKVQA